MLRNFTLKVYLSVFNTYLRIRSVTFNVCMHTHSVYTHTQFMYYVCLTSP